MEFYNSYLYALICKKVDFDILRKAEQVIALCEVEYHLENDCIGRAVSRYEAWQKSFPEGIESEQIPITLQDVCRISDADFCCMPWIYANVLHDLCAGNEPEEGEITAQTELHYMGQHSDATWIWCNDDSYKSFDHAYTKFMKAEWINEFLDKMEIPWPLTSNWSTEVKGEVIWPSEAKFKPLPASPGLAPEHHDMPELELLLEESSIHSVSTILDAPVLDAPVLDAPVLDVPVLDAPVLDAPVLDAPVLDAPVHEHKQKPTGPPKVRDEGFWPFMRCKNVYKAYGGTCRMSHHDLLISLANKFKMSVETLKKTDPYTMNIKGLPAKRWGYY